MLGISFSSQSNITTCTFGLKTKENNENDMTSAVWGFGPVLFSANVYGCSQLFAIRLLLLSIIIKRNSGEPQRTNIES